jgi:hypothetical protein
LGLEEEAPWGVEVEDLGAGCTGGVRHGELWTWGGGYMEDERKRRVGRRPWGVQENWELEFGEVFIYSHPTAKNP